jgi:hypothetical protein
MRSTVRRGKKRPATLPAVTLRFFQLERPALQLQGAGWAAPRRGLVGSLDAAFAAAFRAGLRFRQTLRLPLRGPLAHPFEQGMLHLDGQFFDRGQIHVQPGPFGTESLVGQNFSVPLGQSGHFLHFLVLESWRWHPLPPLELGTSTQAGFPNRNSNDLNAERKYRYALANWNRYELALQDGSGAL